MTAAADERISASEFLAAAPGRVAAINGNTPWAQRMAEEVRQVVYRHAERAPRTLQSHLGPSEVGHACDRQVAGKLAGLPRTNHVLDPWPSIRGTALHAWLEDAFTADNARYPQARWATERRVTPHPEHPGTADLYDAVEQSVDDHKALGETSMNRLRNSGPPIHYYVQLLLYGLGYRLEGYTVRRVAIFAYPATASSLDGLYVWEHELTPADDELLKAVFARLEWRKQWAAALVAGTAQLRDVPADTSDTCHFCDFYRPQSAHDGGPGCPGHAAA